jgi:glycosyltransferase involved in cell wall biosynthesis
MKILVFIHRLIMGGVPINGLELGARLRDCYGHEVVVFGTPGPAVNVANDLGLRFVAAPEPKACPSLTMMAALQRTVQQERPDLIQAWDWQACVDAYPTHLLMGVPLLISHSAMELHRLLPKRSPTTYMTPELIDQAKAVGRSPVALILPPVDTDSNAMSAVTLPNFRADHEIHPGEILVVTVSRLDTWIKSESLIRSIEAMRELGPGLPLKFAIVGDGEARAELTDRASRLNAKLGRPAVILTGELLDPRPAYAAADIVVGMGGSALRGMAFSKPVVVVGKHGFAATFTPETAADFLYRGMYGYGDGSNEPLVAALHELATGPDLRVARGQFSRDFVVENFSLPVVCEHLDAFLSIAATHRKGPGLASAEVLRMTSVYLAGKLLPESAQQWIRSKWA